VNQTFIEDSEDLYDRLKSFIPAAGADSKISSTVTEILDFVKRGGNEAILKKTLLYDGVSLSVDEISIKPEELTDSLLSLSPEQTQALEEAISNVTEFHKQSYPQNWQKENLHGGVVGELYYPINRVGIYVPGGQVPLVSTVIMTVILAKVAGVSEIAVTTPPNQKGEISPFLLAALELSGINEVYKIGGAQAIAAMTYGTKSIKAVNKIFGPGNAWVAEAKRQLFGKVGIDMVAGPSEILVIADDKSNPTWIAADLMSQAEHDVDAQSILITDNLDFAKQVEVEINSLIQCLERAEIAKASWNNNGMIIIVKNWKQSIEIANKIAPEHLEISMDNPEIISDKINNAGSIFLGRFVPEAIGDYIAGPNHVLPTARTAKFSSGISTLDYMRRTSLIKCDLDSLSKIAPSAIRIAENEGLGAHALSMQIRMKNFKNEK